MPARPKNLDMSQLAKRILDEATGDEPKTEAPAEEKKNAAAVKLGKLGGKKGGAARAASLTPEQRSEIARKAAAGRWKAKPQGE
ncbi:histone H1 [Caenimonas sp. S4]|nr:histone H1 [Caenimonas soli]